MKIDFSEEIDMFQDGILPRSTLVTYVLKKIVKSGDKGNYEQLPSWLKELIVQEIEEYEATGIWMIVSNNGTEDFGPIAEKFKGIFLTN